MVIGAIEKGVSFVASKTKSLVDKVGDLWNKGKTKVKNDFIEAGKAFRYGLKKMGEYVPKFGGGPIPVMEGAGKIPSGGKNLLKDAYQYMKDTGEKFFGKGTGNRDADIPPAFKQEEFASTYDSRFKQTPAETNSNVVFEGARGESLCTLKPPPDPTLQKILNEAGINGIEYKNGVPDFSPVAKAQIEIEYMLARPARTEQKLELLILNKQIKSWLNNLTIHQSW